jgi:hypothetical protein
MLLTRAIPAAGNPAHIEDHLVAGFARLPDAGQRRQVGEVWDGSNRLRNARHKFRPQPTGPALGRPEDKLREGPESRSR